MTSRHPRPDADDLAVTHDEIEPVRVELDAVDAEPSPHFAVGSGDHDRARTVSLEAVDMANTEWAHRLEGRITALETDAKRKSAIRVWAERILSALGGSAVVVIAWVMTKAESSGDAKATAREREAERRHMIDTVRALDRRDALQQGQIDALIDRLRYPMQGPPVAPRTDP